MSLQVYKQKTVLVKRNGEKITVDIPYEVVEKAMTTDVLKIGEWHSIRTKAVNERYWVNITNELEAWIDDNYKSHYQEIMQIVKQREKEWLRVNKEIVANIAQDIVDKGFITNSNNDEKHRWTNW